MAIHRSEQGANTEPGLWFVQAGERVWGPYPAARIAAFVQEGRVAPDTLVGLTADGPFQAAARHGRLQGLFGASPPAEPARTPPREREPARQPASSEPARPAVFRPAPEPVREAAAEPASHMGAEPGQQGQANARPLLVWAALKSQGPERFEALLGAYGAFVRIEAGLWLVRSAAGPAGLRNGLTRRLNGGDVLMVVEAPLEQAAWFNLAGDTDRSLRQLWSPGVRSR